MKTLESLILFLFCVNIAAFSQKDEQKLFKECHKIVIAAVNSSNADKSSADIVCTGKNDEKTIQNAINSLGSYGEIQFLAGVYIFDHFQETTDGTPFYALGIPGEDDVHSKIRLIGFDCNSIDIHLGDNPLDFKYNGVLFTVSKSCYDNLDSTQQYAVIRSLKNRKTHLDFRYIAIVLPYNQKNIVCIDGIMFESIRVMHCALQGSDKNRYDINSTPHLGVEGCIGVRGVQGSNNCLEFNIEYVDCTSFGVGFAVGGEHYYGTNLGSVFCRYGFTFNCYPLTSGVWVHPITLINCCDEASANYPLFGDNTGRQPVVIINFNMEHYPNYFAIGGNLATEKVPGQWYGSIDYNIMSFEQDGFYHANTPKKPFWAKGNGQNVTSKNDAQKQMCSKEERLTYAPNFMQTIYDTTLRFPVTCIDPSIPIWIKSDGTRVDN
ncbi:MAG: hypothetical protein Q4F97_03740 [Bacteroidales bacterium]|nr:hypothetical protein [Bacteroidales bacterium]